MEIIIKVDSEEATMITVCVNEQSKQVISEDTLRSMLAK